MSTELSEGGASPELLKEISYAVVQQQILTVAYVFYFHVLQGGTMFRELCLRLQELTGHVCM